MGVEWWGATKWQAKALSKVKIANGINLYCVFSSTYHTKQGNSWPTLKAMQLRDNLQQVACLLRQYRRII